MSESDDDVTIFGEILENRDMPITLFALME